MRTINTIVLHCTATKQNATIKSILKYWKTVKRWKTPGYHYLITATGEIEYIWPIRLPSNGVKGHNKDSIHIGYIGGIDQNNKAIDNRTPKQIAAQVKILKELKKLLPNAKIKGHNEFKTQKQCPSFNVQKWLKTIKL